MLKNKSPPDAYKFLIYIIYASSKIATDETSDSCRSIFA